jgi:peroxiredoxin Q/BCP
MLRTGDKAPDFELQDENGAWHEMSQYHDKKVVLFFYVKDDTPGCTTQACGLRDAAAEYAKHDIVVLGVSFDSPASHKAFKEKYNLPFILLSDPTKTISQKYGVYTEPNLHAKRTTFLIDKGIIKHIYHDINVETHAAKVLESFK